jgi:pilus assembly protein CpaE
VTIFCGQTADSALSDGDALGTVRPVDDIPAAGAALLADPNETVVVLGASVAVEDAFAFAEQLRIERPHVGVILIRESLQIETLTLALRAGVREVVPAGESRALVEAVARSRRLSQRAPVATPAPAAGAPKGEVITIFSAKGGTGKTTIATNLAVALADGGANRVCLLDLDLAFGDVAISLQLEPRRTIMSALSLGEEFDAAKVAALVTNYSPGLDCILAPIEPGDAEKIPPALVEEIIALLTSMYDYVLIDTPPQLSEHVLIALDASHHQVLITTPEVPALKNLRLTLDMLDLLSYGQTARFIVLNRSDADVGLSAADVERVVKSSITAYLPSSRDVPASINRGIPLSAEQPEHPFSRAMRQFAHEHLLGQVPAVAAPTGRRSLRSLTMRRRQG